MAVDEDDPNQWGGTPKDTTSASGLRPDTDVPSDDDSQDSLGSVSSRTPDQNSAEYADMKAAWKKAPFRVISNPDSLATFDGEYTIYSGAFTKKGVLTKCSLKLLERHHAEIERIHGFTVEEIKKIFGGSVGKSDQGRFEVLWPREIAWAFLDDGGVVLSWSIIEILPLIDLVDMMENGNEFDVFTIFRNKKLLHGLTYDPLPRGHSKALGLKDALHALQTHYACLNMKTFWLKGAIKERRMLRRMFRHYAEKSGDPRMKLTGSNHWQFVSPERHYDAFGWKYMEQFVIAIKGVLPEHTHSNIPTARLHCSGLECMKYAAYHTPGGASVAHNDDAAPLNFSYYGLVREVAPDYTRPAVSAVHPAPTAPTPAPATTAATEPASMDPEH